MHIVQDEPNELYGQLASISNRPTTCIAANFSSKAIKVLWLIMMMITMIMMTLRIILIMPWHPNSPQLGNQSLFKKNYESEKPFNNFPNTSRLKIYERSRSSSDERKGRPPGAPSLLYELRCYFHLFIFLMLLKLKCNLSFSILWCLRSHCDYRYDHEKQHLVLVVKECRVSLYCCCLPNIYQKWTF